MCVCLYDYMYIVHICVHVCICLYMSVYVLWGRIIVYHSDYPATLQFLKWRFSGLWHTWTGYKAGKVWRRKDAGVSDSTQQGDPAQSKTWRSLLGGGDPLPRSLEHQVRGGGATVSHRGDGWRKDQDESKREDRTSPPWAAWWGWRPGAEGDVGRSWLGKGRRCHRGEWPLPWDPRSFAHCGAACSRLHFRDFALPPFQRASVSRASVRGPGERASLRDPDLQPAEAGWGVRPLQAEGSETGLMLGLPSSVRFTRSVVSDSWRPHEPQHARPSCPSPAPRAYSNSRPLSRWCHPTISSSVVSFSSRLQSFPASRSFRMSQLFTSGGLSIGISASASVLLVNTQSPLGWTGWISLLFKGLSGVFSKTTVQKHQFFSAQLSL